MALHARSDNNPVVQVSTLLRLPRHVVGQHLNARGLSYFSDDPWIWTYRSGALAALGNVEQAKVSVKAALKWFPDLNDAERKRLIETMRLAGFPPCAKPEALAKIEKPLRLSECQSQP